MKASSKIRRPSASYRCAAPALPPATTSWPWNTPACLAPGSTPAAGANGFAIPPARWRTTTDLPGALPLAPCPVRDLTGSNSKQSVSGSSITVLPHYDMSPVQQISRLTSKYQATIPQAIRRKLNLKPGDAVVFEIENDTVTGRRATALDKEYAKAIEGTLTEWLSKEDDEAYGGL